MNESLYELRMEYNSNIYRIFFIFDDGKIVVLFNGFQKKTQKTPQSEIEKALKIKEAYYGDKQSSDIGTSERAQFDEEAYAFYTSQILLDARKEAKMTQSKLAERIHVRQNPIFHGLKKD